MFRTTHALVPTGRFAGSRLMPPWVIVSVLLVLITSQVLYVFFPYRRRTYPGVLLLTAIGFGLGQLWDYLGLPASRFGQANLIPALLIAISLQFLAPWVLITLPKRD